MINPNDSVALDSAPGTIIGTVAAISQQDDMCLIRQDGGGWGAYAMSQLVQFFTPGWYRRDSESFNPPFSNEVTVVYRPTPSFYPEYTVLVEVKDA